MHSTVFLFMMVTLSLNDFRVKLKFFVIHQLHNRSSYRVQNEILLVRIVQRIFLLSLHLERTLELRTGLGTLYRDYRVSSGPCCCFEGLLRNRKKQSLEILEIERT